MRSSHTLDRLDTAFDGTQLVADAGLLLPATLAHHLGLKDLVDEQTHDFVTLSGRLVGIIPLMRPAHVSRRRGSC